MKASSSAEYFGRLARRGDDARVTNERLEHLDGLTEEAPLLPESVGDDDVRGRSVTGAERAVVPCREGRAALWVKSWARRESVCCFRCSLVCNGSLWSLLESFSTDAISMTDGLVAQKEGFSSSLCRPFLWAMVAILIWGTRQGLRG